ncbi:hypothetical protein FACS1894211_01480 [Clostridia bacterium]|nr:hypothetical protein FACS1894211_01480 [Clostridia bacterium]
MGFDAMEEEKPRKILKLFPLYTLIPTVACLLTQEIIYFGSKLADGRFHYDFTLAFDRAVPVIGFFAVFYILSFPYWFFTLTAGGNTGKKNYYRFITCLFFQYAVCLTIFLVLPTTIVQPELDTTKFGEWLIGVIYSFDTPTNLFPSIHVLMSWLCFCMVRGRKDVRPWLQISSCVMAVLVLLSTQFIKQHYIVDAIAGVFLAELFWFLTGRFPVLVRPFERFFEMLNGKAARLGRKSTVDNREQAVGDCAQAPRTAGDGEGEKENDH